MKKLIFLIVVCVLVVSCATSVEPEVIYKQLKLDISDSIAVVKSQRPSEEPRIPQVVETLQDIYDTVAGLQEFGDNWHWYAEICEQYLDELKVKLQGNPVEELL